MIVNVSIMVAAKDYETRLKRSSMEAAAGRSGEPSGSSFHSELTDAMNKGHQDNGHVNERDAQASDIRFSS